MRIRVAIASSATLADAATNMAARFIRSAREAQTGIILVTASALALASCGEPRSLEAELAQAVREVNAGGGQTFGSEMAGAKLNARIDNGDTLVLVMSNVLSGSRTYDPNAIRKDLRPNVCGEAHYRRIIDGGFKLKIEMISNTGKELPPVIYARC